jgi:predicted RNA binding protein YcfA (HicA-like mRNA interferase family)
MGKREKLIELICVRRPPEARFSDVKQLLEREGFAPRRQRGSHVTFGKEGSRAIVIPISDGKAKSVYLDRICADLGLELE